MPLLIKSYLTMTLLLTFTIVPMGIVKATKHIKETEKQYDFLRSSEVMDVLLKYGFSAPPAL